MKTGEPVESLSLSKFLVLYMRKYQITYVVKFYFTAIYDVVGAGASETENKDTYRNFLIQFNSMETTGKLLVPF